MTGPLNRRRPNLPRAPCAPLGAPASRHSAKPPTRALQRRCRLTCNPAPPPSAPQAALKLGGFADKLPAPGALPLTLLVPSNSALLKMLWDAGFMLPMLSSAGDALPAALLYNALLSPLPPETIAAATEAAPGSAPSAYGLLSGADFPLSYYREGDKNVFRSGGAVPVSGNAARAGDPVDACGSFIYVTDRVLIPAASLKEVNPVDLSGLDALGFGGGSPAPAAPAPAAPPPAALAPAVCALPGTVQPLAAAPAAGAALAAPLTVAAPAPAPLNAAAQPLAMPDPLAAPAPAAAPAAPCAESLADAARAQGLNLLATALAQPALAAQLPDPSLPATFLAPTDAAFMGMLTTLSESRVLRPLPLDSLCARRAVPSPPPPAPRCPTAAQPPLAPHCVTLNTLPPLARPQT